jgi:phage shock protein E
MLRLAALGGLVAVCTACSKPAVDARSASGEAAPGEPERGGLPDRDGALAKRLVEQEGALLLDVRSGDEYAGGHVPGARNIPHDELEGRLEEVMAAQGGDKNKPIVVYCASGRRSGIAKNILVDAGFARVTNLGGVDDWPR